MDTNYMTTAEAVKKYHASENVILREAKEAKALLRIGRNYKIHIQRFEEYIEKKLESQE